MRFLVFLLALFAWLSSTVQAAPSIPLYRDPHAPLEARVDDLLGRLTPDEELSLLSGTGATTQPIPRLGVPALAMADAGQGVRGGVGSTIGPATLFPAGVTMASTWDPALIGRVGQAIGAEALNKGTGSQMLLGPAINIQRSPLGGRNGEYFSEDPYLAGRLAVGYIQGLQSTGCAACVKHFACYNQELNRDFIDVQVSERALREIYLPAFEAAVKDGHAWSLMSSYNKINGLHASADPYLLTTILKDEWGFDGVVLSDWGGVHETAAVVRAGNDLEMPGPGWLSLDRLGAALDSRRITPAQVDSNVRRILRTVLRVGLLDPDRPAPDPRVVNSPAHQRLAYQAACAGIVLLKNAKGLLPLSVKGLKSIAVIGPAATDMQYGAAGSAALQPFFTVSPLAGITARAGKSVTVRYASGVGIGDPIPPRAFTQDDGTPGLRAQYWPNPAFAGIPQFTRTEPQIRWNWGIDAPAPGIGPEQWSARWIGRLHAPATGRYTLTLTVDDGCRLWLDNKLVIDRWTPSPAIAAPVSGTVDLVRGHTYALRVEYYQGTGLALATLSWTLPGQAHFAAAVNAARHSDVAVVCVGTANTEGEGLDRPSMDLPADQDLLIQAVAAANPRTIVVLNNGTPVTLTRWLPRVPALLEAWFPGEDGGHALASLLFGDVNPSGKLPTTFGVRREDYPDFGHFPGAHGQVQYAEGIYVGYRHFDKARIAPIFPFGYGLSYTTFRYSHLRLSSPTLSPQGTVTARVDLTNTGHRPGAEVVQLYVSDATPQEDRPVRELKAFQKVQLAPGQTKTVTLTLAPRALAYCDVPGKQWKADAGLYTLAVGASSRDLRLTAPLRLSADFTEPIPGMSPPPEHDPVDLALNRPATASSIETPGGPNPPNLDPGNAVDGDDTTRWSSQFADPQWLAVDLGQPQTVGCVRLTWEVAYASAYTLQTSLDGTHWTDVYTTTAGEGGTEDDPFPPVTARWVRIFCTERGTQFGYSLLSFQVFRK